MESSTKPTVEEAANSILDTLYREGFTLDEAIQIKDELRVLLQKEAEEELASEEKVHNEKMSNLKKLRASI